MTASEEELKITDLRIDMFSGGPLSPVCVRITHLPTGLSAKVTGISRIQTRASAMAKLWRMVREKAGTP